MATFTYTALAELVDPLNDGTIQTIEFPLAAFTPPRVVPQERRIKTIGGLEQVYVYRVEQFVDLIVTRITEQQFPQWREFFYSVSGGRAFVFDPKGTAAEPSQEDYTAKLTQRSELGFRRVGNGDRFHLPLSLEVV